ncbi:hypothetical protein Gpo141_00012709 [Globisporangium polare]
MLRTKGLARRSLRAAAPRAGGASVSGASLQRSFATASPPEKPHWSGINTYYVSMRGLGIATRVATSMPDFFRFYEGDVFAKHVNDDARSAMFVLTQFPSATRVDLLEFRDAAEQLVHTVYEQMYATHSAAKSAAGAIEQDQASDAQSIDDSLGYLGSITSDDKSAEILKHKAALQAKSLTPGNNSTKRVILEQLSVNRVGIAAVDYKSVQYSEEEMAKRGYEEEEWLEIQVQYDVTEHLQLSSVGGIDDRKTVNTTFTWTFESNVTFPDQVEWQIVDATPFAEKSALLTPKSAAAEDSETK